MKSRVNVVPVEVELSVSENLEQDEDVPDLENIMCWANAACATEKGSNENLIASFQILNQEEMRSLNQEFGGKNKSTNVLSFPTQLPEEINHHLIGDIALCAQVINEEARQQDKKPNSHWAHMVVHGMLHLQGYDHIENNDADEMEAFEVKILDQLGIDSPYE